MRQHSSIGNMGASYPLNERFALKASSEGHA
jgi:hypothetical protein